MVPKTDMRKDQQNSTFSQGIKLKVYTLKGNICLDFVDELDISCVWFGFLFMFWWICGFFGPLPYKSLAGSKISTFCQKLPVN